MSGPGLWWGTLEGAGLLELARAAGAAGFEQISVSPPLYFTARASGLGDADLRRALADAGVGVAMLDPLIRGLPGSPVPEQVPRRFRATFEHDFDACLRAAEALGARAVNLAHYLCAPAAQAELVDAIAALCTRAAERGLQVWLEFMPDGGIPDLASAAALLRAVAAPELGLTIDTWHLFRTGEAVERLGELPAGSIRALQLADARADVRGSGTRPPTADRLLPGAGDVPLRQIVALARANCAQVALGVEVFDRARLADPPLERARAAAAALQSLLG